MWCSIPPADFSPLEAISEQKSSVSNSGRRVVVRRTIVESNFLSVLLHVHWTDFLLPTVFPGNGCYFHILLLGGDLSRDTVYTGLQRARVVYDQTRFEAVVISFCFLHHFQERNRVYIMVKWYCLYHTSCSYLILLIPTQQMWHAIWTADGPQNVEMAGSDIASFAWGKRTAKSLLATCGSICYDWGYKYLWSLCANRLIAVQGRIHRALSRTTYLSPSIYLRLEFTSRIQEMWLAITVRALLGLFHICTYLVDGDGCISKTYPDYVK